MKRGARQRGSSRLFSIIMIFVALYGIFVGVKLVLKWMYPIRYESYIEEYADKNGLEHSFVFAVIKAESGFNPDAISSIGAKGLMQLTPDTFSWLQTKTKEKLPDDALFDPETNIRYGTLLLSILKGKYNDVSEILCGYHAGIGITRTWLNDPELSKDGKTLNHIPYDDTRSYVSRVKKNIKIYNWLYGGQM